MRRIWWRADFKSLIFFRFRWWTLTPGDLGLRVEDVRKKRGEFRLASLRWCWSDHLGMGTVMIRLKVRRFEIYWFKDSRVDTLSLSAVRTAGNATNTACNSRCTKPNIIIVIKWSRAIENSDQSRLWRLIRARTLGPRSASDLHGDQVSGVSVSPFGVVIECCRNPSLYGPWRVREREIGTTTYLY